MLAAILLAQKPAIVDFKGGSAEKFVGAIADVLHTPVMAAFSREVKVDPIKIDLSQRDSAFSAINSKTKLTMVGGTDWLLHDNYYPEEWFTKLAASVVPAARTNVQNLSKLVSDGTVTWDSRHQGLFNFGDLQKANFSKKLTVFWMFRPEALAVSVKKEPEKEFLINAAKACGGLLTTTNDGYVIQADWSHAYGRLDKTAAQMISRDAKVPYQIQLQRELWYAMLQEIGPSYMSDFMDNPLDPKSLSVGGESPYASSVLAYVREISAEASAQGGRRQRDSGIINRLDPRMPAKVRLFQDGGIVIEVAVLSGGRRNRSSYIRI